MCIFPHRGLTPETTSNPWFKYYYKEEYCGGKTGECEHNVYDQVDSQVLPYSMELRKLQNIK